MSRALEQTRSTKDYVHLPLPGLTFPRSTLDSGASSSGRAPSCSCREEVFGCLALRAGGGSGWMGRIRHLPSPSGGRAGVEHWIFKPGRASPNFGGAGLNREQACPNCRLVRPNFGLARPNFGCGSLACGRPRLNFGSARPPVGPLYSELFASPCFWLAGRA